MSQTSTTGGSGARAWAEQSLGERIVTAAWRAVAAHLAGVDPTFGVDPPRAPIPDPTRTAEQVATGGAGAIDGVTDDALLPPALRERLQ